MITGGGCGKLGRTAAFWSRGVCFSSPFFLLTSPVRLCPFFLLRLVFVTALDPLVARARKQNKSLVVLNGPLCDNLYKPMNKKAPRVEYPTEVTFVLCASFAEVSCDMVFHDGVACGASCVAALKGWDFTRNTGQCLHDAAAHFLFLFVLEERDVDVSSFFFFLCGFQSCTLLAPVSAGQLLSRRGGLTSHPGANALPGVLLSHPGV